MAPKFQDQAVDLLSYTADAIWRCSTDLQIDHVEVLQGKQRRPQLMRLRGRRLDDLAGSAFYPLQASALEALLEQRAEFRDVGLTLPTDAGGVEHYLINAKPQFDDTGAFRGYTGVVRCWSQLPFDQFRRGEMVEARRREDAAQANETLMRRDAEVLLSALQVLMEQSSLQDKCAKLFSLFAPILQYDDAVVLRRGQNARMVVAAASDPSLLGVPWPEDAVLKKAMDGQACLLTGQSICSAGLQFPSQLGKVGALLLVPLEIGSETAVIVIIGHEDNKFAARHLALMRRLNLMAAKLLQDEDQRAALLTSAKLAAVGELTATIVHELVQPITIISMSASACRALLARGKDLTKATQKLDQIKTATGRAIEIARSMRELSYSNSSTATTSLIDIRTALKAVETIAEIGLKERNIDLSFKISDECPPIMGHQTWLQQVILNLINNARDAILEKQDANTAMADGRITVFTRWDDRVVVIGVADNGGGIPDDLRERIFTPFFTLKPIGKGTGLGLALCRRLVTDMDGEITLRNENGGAVFELFFPHACDNEEALSEAAEPVSATG